jgi:TonB family protein
MAVSRGHLAESIGTGGRNGIRSAMSFSLVLHTCISLALLFGGFPLRHNAAALSPLMVDLVSGPDRSGDRAPGASSGSRAVRSDAERRDSTILDRTGPVPPPPLSEEALRQARSSVQDIAVSRVPEGDGPYTTRDPAKGHKGGTGTAGFVHAVERAGDTAIPRYAENAPPVYPSKARKNGMEGTVILSVEVLPNGAVGDLRVKKASGHSLLDHAAVEAVKAWRFHPATRLGRPVASRVEIPVRFFLQKRPSFSRLFFLLVPGLSQTVQAT